ncbi:MAG: hypothetical protein LBD53_10015 [Tannerella sp.]|nr:hypothetical protein [Tannerella sp.]
MGRHLVAPTLIMTDVSSKPLAGFKTTARVQGTVITYSFGAIIPAINDVFYLIASLRMPCTLWFPANAL